MKDLQYAKYNNHEVAIIANSGSTSLAQTIFLKEKPDYTIVSVSNNEAAVADAWNKSGVWQRVVPKTKKPTNPIIPVRDPIERFKSACIQVGRAKEINKVLAELESGDRKTTDNKNFIKTIDFCVGESRLYKFPDHISYLADALGVSEFPHINQTIDLSLNKKQIERVSAYYAEDIDLFNSINSAGQVYVVKNKLEEKKEEIEKAFQRLKEIRLEDAAGITIGEITLSTNKADAQRYARLLNVIQLHADLKDMPSTVSIDDKSGNIHELTIDDAKSLLVQYEFALQERVALRIKK